MLKFIRVAINKFEFSWLSCKVSFTAELQYSLSERPKLIYNEIPDYIAEWEWVVLLAPSKRQVGFDYIGDQGDTIIVNVMPANWY